MQVSSASMPSTRENLNCIGSTLAERAGPTRSKVSKTMHSLVQTWAAVSRVSVEIAGIDRLAGKAKLQHFHLTRPVEDFSREEIL